MTVTAIGANGYTVTRGVAGTTGVSHPKGAFVMSILLPILPSTTPATIIRTM